MAADKSSALPRSGDSHAKGEKRNLSDRLFPQARTEGLDFPVEKGGYWCALSCADCIVFMLINDRFERRVLKVLKAFLGIFDICSPAANRRHAQQY